MKEGGGYNPTSGQDVERNVGVKKSSGDVNHCSKDRRIRGGECGCGGYSNEGRSECARIACEEDSKQTVRSGGEGGGVIIKAIVGVLQRR